MSSLNRKAYQIENFLPHLIRTQDFVRELEDSRERGESTQTPPDEVQLVVLDDVHFSYQSQESEALSGVSMTLNKGEFVGVVGQSGAGKSTVVSLLARFYEPDSGEIRADGRSIHNMLIDDWRSRVAVVRQDPFIFNDTLEFNLIVGNRDVSDSRLHEVVEIAEIDEFFNELPAGYETQLGDNSVLLSGGQKQRVALARALLTDADILLLDEATSDLDSSLEKRVQRSIEGLDQNYGIINIAHRLSTVENADRIYTIESGEIVEQDRHGELAERDGQYAELHRLQSNQAP